MLDIQVYRKVCELVDTALFILGISVFLSIQGHNPVKVTNFWWLNSCHP